MRAVVQPDALEQMVGAAHILSATAEGHAEQHIFQSGEGGQQIECLEHVAHFRRAESISSRFGQSADFHAVEHDLARIGTTDAGDHVQQRGLSATAWA